MALRDIKKGEELSYDYGYEFDDDWGEHDCRCGAKDCVGYIVDQDDWSRLRRAKAAKKAWKKRKSKAK